ncbi:MAG: alginate export family protein [candidate division Zixibacteria bacterium]|nr:alginate export family protein [candidate division Zixibacteria bacterium]
MKKTLTTTLLLTGLLLAATTAYADGEVKVTGEVRARAELTDITLNKRHWLKQVSWLRTRVGIEADIKGNTRAFVQFQDSRQFGGKTHEGDQASGGTNAGVNVDLHQAYIEIDRLWFDGFGVKVGRFELNFGNQRVLGGAGWSNVGRSWEGLMHWYDTDKMKLSGFMVKRIERTEPRPRVTGGNADYDIWGIYYQNKRLHLDLFALLDSDAYERLPHFNRLSRFSFGTYYAREHKHMDYTLNAVVQTGKDGRTKIRRDISAYMVNFEAGYNFDTPTSPRLAIGFDFQSGDETNDDKIESYNNLYYTGHKFNGYMDYFLSSATSGNVPAGAGLIDLMAKGSCRPWPDWAVALDIHYFRTDVKYTWDPDDNPRTNNTVTGTDLGIELDLTVKTKSVPGFDLVWGVSYFLPEDRFAGIDNHAAGFWSYMMGTAGF